MRSASFPPPSKKGMESDRIHASAVLCQDYCHLPSHWNADKTLSDWLKENNVPGMYGI